MTVDIINPNGKANIILVSEHASNYIPPEFNNLGLSNDQLKLHIAWDIGIGQVTRNLSQMLDAPAVLARFSRLLIDANRGLDQDGLIPTISDGHNVKSNQNLSKEDVNRRIERFYKPFHDATDNIIRKKQKATHAPIIFNMHSFTPEMNGVQRPWHCGMLWNKDSRVADALKSRLENRGYLVGDNQPYSGQELNHTMNTHGTRHGYPHVNIEIRQNEIDTDAGILKWSEILKEEIIAIRQLPEMSNIEHY